MLIKARREVWPCGHGRNREATGDDRMNRDSRVRRSRLWGASAILAVVLVGSGAAYPQSSEQSSSDQPSRSRLYKSVETACKADYLRFCPTLDPIAAGPRGQVICLKNFAPDLSLGCRKAVRAASQH